MIKLNKRSESVLQQLIIKYPELKKVAFQLNSSSVNWAMAAGTAYDIYFGQLNPDADDIDIFIDINNKDTVSKIFKIKWELQSSERHRALNIKSGIFDFFTNCIKYKNGKMVLNYVWTDNVSRHLRINVMDGICYNVISPEDVIILKKANPRGINELNQIKFLMKTSDNNYLKIRLGECKIP